MLPKPSEQPESPRRKANPLRVLFFSWLIPLFVKGSQKDLDLKDIYRVLPEDETRRLADNIEAAWLEQVEKTEEKNRQYESSGQGDNSKILKPSLVKALLKVFGGRMAFLGFFAFLEEAVIKVGQPIILGYLLDYFNNPSEFEPWQGYLFAGGVLFFTIWYTSTDHPFTFAVQHLGMQMRISLCSLIYRKALRVSKYAMEQTPAGQITNFLSSDMNRFDIFFTFCHYTWVAPIQLFNVIIVLYYHVELGLASLAGLFLIFLFVPFQGYMGSMFSKLRTETAARTDERLLALEEVLSAMRVIKAYTWEKPFCAVISESRKAEVRKLKKTAMCRALNQSFFSVTSRTTLFITLLVYVLTGHTLTARKVYTTLTLYTAVQTVMTLFFPLAVIATAETLVAIGRIRKFLLMDEKFVPMSAIQNELEAERVRRYDWTLVTSDEQSISSQYTYTTTSFATTTFSECGVWVKNISAQWNPQNKELSFSNVSFDVRGGELLAIIGPTASGKSSVLNSLLYELPLQSGEFRLVGQVAYSCQEPWVFNGSVRDNILFGKPYNASWYDEVTEACALVKDFQLLTYGDRSLVGEKGSELSGGQKARVTLARAVYADADIYLLDDPLSAVDAHVSRHIVEKCILGLLKNKCRILVTHQLQHLKLVDKVLVMVDGSVAHMGDHKSLLRSGVPYSDLLTVHDMAVSLGNRRSSKSLSESSLSTTGAGVVPSDKTPSVDIIPVKVRDVMVDEGPEILEEYMMEGRITLKTFYRYLHAGSSLASLLLLAILYVVAQGLVTGTDLWLQYWVNIEKRVKEGTLTPSTNPLIHSIQESRMVRIGIYSGLIVLLFTIFLTRTQMFFRFCMKSSVVIYDRLFLGVVRSPMSFFERTPVGRILNRFAKDICIIDENLPQALYDVTEIIMQTLGIFCLLAANTTIMLIPSAILVILLYALRKFYFRSAISIKRLEGVARSPIFNHLSTTLMGLSTIRAFGVEQKFVREFEEIHDLHNSTWYMFLCGTRWLGITVDWFVIFFIAGVELNFLINIDSGDNIAGVTITSAMMLTSMLQWGMRQSAETENFIVSFERVAEYCELPSEAPLESAPDKKPPPNWPSIGEIKMRNLCLRYYANNKTMVLKYINCTINGGEKVGIVGRTGAGKSSMINVLFRLSEPTSGYIEIDGVETTSIGLHDLRSKLSIIPQEPVIFGGTVRTNLDPFGEYTDAQVWTALQEAHLADTIKLMEGGLESEISEGGSNFSVGQKQLICLARCILKSNKILILDEATANIDPETDRLIQKTIRKNFADCTVLTIAHRLHTVMDSDRILVLNAGQIIEFDEPEALLNNRHSMLYSLVQQTGKAEATHLAQIAKLAALRRRNPDSLSKDPSSDSKSYESSYTTISTGVGDKIRN